MTTTARDQAAPTNVDQVKGFARLRGVAVLAVGRPDYERALNRPLTEEEWGRVAPQNSDLDVWVGDNVIHSFIGAVLDDAGIDREESL